MSDDESRNSKPIATNYWIDFIEEMSSRGLENSVYSITYQVLNTLQEIFKRNEWTFSLHVCIPVQYKQSSTLSTDITLHESIKSQLCLQCRTEQ